MTAIQDSELGRLDKQVAACLSRGRFAQALPLAARACEELRRRGRRLPAPGPFRASPAPGNPRLRGSPPPGGGQVAGTGQQSEPAGRDPPRAGPARAGGEVVLRGTGDSRGGRQGLPRVRRQPQRPGPAVRGPGEQPAGGGVLPAGAGNPPGHAGGRAPRLRANPARPGRPVRPARPAVPCGEPDPRGPGGPAPDGRGEPSRLRPEPGGAGTARGVSGQ